MTDLRCGVAKRYPIVARRGDGVSPPLRCSDRPRGYRFAIPLRFSQVASGDGEVLELSFDGMPVRTVKIDGEPFFVGKDAAERLGYADPSTAIRSHCKGVQKLHPLSTDGGKQTVRVLAEPDVLRLIVGSKLRAAQRFDAWVFEEVLPAIRRSGGYLVAAPEELALRAMQVLQATVERQKAQLAINPALRGRAR